MRTQAVVLVAAVLLGAAPSGLSQVDVRPAPPEIELLVKQAVEDRFARRDLPDQKLLGDATRIAVREELPDVGLKLGQGALPQLDGYEFQFISAAAAQRAADRERRAVHFITTDRPAITGEEATVTIGMDVALPGRLTLVKMCCCSAGGRFRRADGRWTFVRWLTILCQ